MSAVWMHVTKTQEFSGIARDYDLYHVSYNVSGYCVYQKCYQLWSLSKMSEKARGYGPFQKCLRILGVMVCINSYDLSQ